MSDKQKAVKKLDRVFSQFIRKRDTKDGWGKCCSCGKRIAYEKGDCGHFINRRFMATRWREDNSHFQCRRCNRFEEGNGVGYTLFMIDKYGREHVEYLRVLKNETMRFSVGEIELMIKDYKQKLKELET